MSQIRHALTVKREDDFAKWYQEVISAADLAEESGVRGCMVIKPWGYGIWERIQRLMDDRIKAAGVQNCYFPLFIPLSNFTREAEHVEGFAKEMAVVTHHRLISDGKGGDGTEPLGRRIGSHRRVPSGGESRRHRKLRRNSGGSRQRLSRGHPDGAGEHHGAARLHAR